MSELQKPSYLKVFTSLLLSLIATTAVIYAGVKSIIFFTPFVIAWIIAMAVSPIVRLLERRLKIVRKLGSAITILTVIAAVLIGIYALVVELWELVARYISDFPELYQAISLEIGRAVDTLNVLFDKLPIPVQMAWDTLVNELGVIASEIITNLSQPTM